MSRRGFWNTFYRAGAIRADVRALAKGPDATVRRVVRKTGIKAVIRGTTKH